ncbi:MAG: type IIA DNA topoisomerase subunit B [Rhodothermaceae bacterium]|nr:type IIA DNA topoisomerase subunit B [Rhodothermaceae bacterium]MYE63897.1 type IIA DNA topoisomerase subunit B [Rhodothermaceae bacterium]MYJ21773.1 type IIA DNA topoisomerase subunit B [Rhodothermaceae bacterium]
MSSYSGADIIVLEGLKAVRKRPGMYIGGTGKPGLHHLLWEIVDNGVDEAVNGHANCIEVTLHKDAASVTVRDNGRGIPVDPHPQKKIPALEVIMTTLHSGGKFEGDQYVTSGGLHGVGASVVNALSKELVARVKRGGTTYEQRFQRGRPVSKLVDLNKRTRLTGTSIYFAPDADIFDSVAFDASLIRAQLEIKAYLNRGLRIIFRDENQGEEVEFVHEGGIVDYLGHLIQGDGVSPVHPEVFSIQQDTFENGVRLEVAVQWTESTRECVKSYVNGIPTNDGGTHEQGYKDAVRTAVRSWMDTHNAIPRGVEVNPEDIREGLFAVINMFMSEPQFQGQTKDKLNNPSARSLVSGTVRVALEQFLNSHPSASDAIGARVLQAARARQASRAAAKSVRSKARQRRRLMLPGKLADCSSMDPTVGELFIVEGDSAGGSAKQGRDRKTQAVLPLRGKVLNAEQATTQKLRNNTELSNVVQALGCGMGDNLEPDKLRYHKVILLMDADSDGHHIATLMLTFFYRYMRPLIDLGHIYIAEPPLYRLDAGKETYWALDEEEKSRIERRLRRKNSRIKIDVQRFKGLGEMMPQTLKETTLDPARRRILQVTIPEKTRAETTISGLMGRDSSVRYRFIMENARKAEDLDV